MSREQAEVIRSLYEAFNDRDLERILPHFADDAEWRLIGGFEAMTGATFTGHEGLRTFFEDWWRTLGGTLDLETVLDAGDDTVAVARLVGAGASSGAPAVLRFGQVTTFRGGRIASVDNYYDAGEALEAVGLRE